MKVLDIIRKDLKIVLSDKKALAILLLMPVILTGILSFALKGTFVNQKGQYKTKIAIVKNYNKELEYKEFLKFLHKGGFKKENTGDEDFFDVEEIFFEEFLHDNEVKEIIEYRIVGEEKAINLLKRGDVSAVVTLPQDFFYNMSINMMTPFRNKVYIKVMGHPDKKISAQITKGMIEAFFNTISSTIIGKNVFLEISMEHGLDLSFTKMKEIVTKFDGDARDNISIKSMMIKGRKPISSFDYYAIAMMTMFILFTAGQGGRLLLEEKRNITYQRMIIAGTSKEAILAGKFLTIFTIGLLQIIIMILFSSVVLKVQWGNIFLVMLISLCSSLAVAGVGLMIAVLTYRSGNYKFAELFNSLIIQVMALLGGSFFPVELLPSFIQKVSFLSLNGVALNSFLKVMRGYGLAEINCNLLILVATGTVFVFLASWLFKGKGGDDACCQ